MIAGSAAIPSVACCSMFRSADAAVSSITSCNLEAIIYKVVSPILFLGRKTCQERSIAAASLILAARIEP